MSGHMFDTLLSVVISGAPAGWQADVAFFQTISRTWKVQFSVILNVFENIVPSRKRCMPIMQCSLGASNHFRSVINTMQP